METLNLMKRAAESLSSRTAKIVAGSLLCALLATSAQAQTLGEFKPKDNSYGVKKTKDATKIYIFNFTVNYQIYNEKEKFKQGGYQFGGGVQGDAKVSASVGLAGLTDADIQQITDKLYQDFITPLKAAGLTIVSADEASKIEQFADYTRMQGGKVSYAQYPGLVTTAPKGYEWFVKSVDESGKTKSGGFLGNANMQFPKISKQLDDAIVADVNLFVLFVEDKNAFQGGGANIKIKTNLRLADSEGLITTSQAAIKLKGQNTVTYVNSAVNFSHGKMGLGSTSSYTGALSKPLEIADVIEDTKITSFARASTDWVGTKTIYGTYFNPGDSSNETTKVLEVDSKKYSDGVYQAAKKFIDHHTTEFLNARK